MIFHWRWIDTKSPQLAGTLLSILAVLNNALVWMVSTLLATSKSSSHFNNLLASVPKALITIAFIVTCMFSIPKRGRGTYPSFTFFQFYSVVSQDSNVENFASSLYYYYYHLLIRVFHITGSWWSFTVFEWQRVSSDFKRLQHLIFLSGHPSKYWRGLNVA